MSQQTLEGEDAHIPLDLLEEVEFVVYETNVTPVLEKSKGHFREECTKQAISQFKQIGLAEQSDKETEHLAEIFVESIFSSVWDKIDGKGYSLWIQHNSISDNPKHTREYPIYIESPVGTFMSSFRKFSEDDPEKVSENFLRACGQLPDDSEETNGWSNCSDELWGELSDIERNLVYDIRNALVGQLDMSVELALLMEKGKQCLEDS